ncbi:hypothetical protein [Flavobacterium sp. GNP001]
MSNQKKLIEKPIEIHLKEEKVLYKSKETRAFNMKGMFYQNLNPKIHNGGFIGYVKTGNTSQEYVCRRNL